MMEDDDDNDAHCIEYPSMLHVRTHAEENRGIARHYTPPIDNFLVDQSAATLDRAVHVGVTPNILSIFGGILAFLALVFLYYDHLVPFVLLFAASYLLDTVDGYVARTYNMKSKAGEYLDHGKDIIVSIILVIIVIYKYSTGMPLWVSLLLLAFYATSFVAEGCSQRAIQNESGENLIGGMASLCPNFVDAEWTRHFATPTFLLATGATLLGLSIYRRGKKSQSVWK